MPQKFKYTSDLHGHSIYSDGKCSPSEIVDIAVQNKIDIIALTDHNNTLGLKEFEDKINSTNNIIGISGIEVSTEFGHIIFLFENANDAIEFAKNIDKDGKNKLANVINSSKKFSKYIIIPHPEVPFIGSFSYESIEDYKNNYPKEWNMTGIEALNGESLIMPTFMLKKHNELSKINTKQGWNRKLFGNSDYHSKNSIGVGVTDLESSFEINTAKDFIENIKNGTNGKITTKKRLSKYQIAYEYAGLIKNVIVKA